MARLTIGQTGQISGPRAFGGLALEYQNTPLLVFHVFRLFTRRQNCKDFSLLRLVYRLRKLKLWHLSFVSDFKELNQVAPRFMTQESNRNQCSHGRPQTSFQRGRNVENLLILFRLLTMQRKGRFTKPFTFSTSLACTG